MIISVDHEPAVAEGINPSPWFAFRLDANTARTAEVVLDYTDYTHRYAPLVSSDGLTWTALEAESVTLNEKETRARLKLSVPDGGLFIAGQPLSPSLDNLAWTRGVLAGHDFNETRYGESLRGNPLIAFSAGGEAGKGVVIAITRQHPPETTGQDAYRGFVARLMKREDEAARKFRSAHRVLLAPMPNPDGVDGGHWRLNAGGVDLNRDWGEFTQPESKALSNWILHEATGRETVAFMDFHSTNRTVIYAPPLDAPSPTIGLLPFLEEHYRNALSAPPEWSYSHNANGGTSKGWALETLKAPGVTVELSDHIPSADARALGAATADAMIAYFTR